MKDSENPGNDQKDSQQVAPPKPRVRTPELVARCSTPKIIPFTGKTKLQIKTSAKNKLKRIEKKTKATKAKLHKEEKRLFAAKEGLKQTVRALEGKNPIVAPEIIERTTPTLKEEIEKRVVFRPNPGPQTDFLAADEKEVLYGGARGGGKTYAMIVDPLRYVENKNHSFLFLRKHLKDLNDVINHTQNLYKAAYPKATYRVQDREWRFPSGARGTFGHVENDDALMQYQGQAYTWIGVDEIGQFATNRVLYDLKGSLRTTDPTIKTYFRATANPGGPGHMWLKEEFVDPAPPGQAFNVEIKTPRGIMRVSRRFIPAKLDDNPHLQHNDDYYMMLASLPEHQRRQWMDGDWDVIGGAAFPEFNRAIHVFPADKFHIPITWPRFRSCDWGYSSPFCVLWFAVDQDGVMYCYREFYGKGMDAEQFAKAVRYMERDDQKPMMGVMDASAWQARGNLGPSIAETINKQGLGFRPSDRSANSRLHGKLEVHRRLAIDPILKKHHDEVKKNHPEALMPLSRLVILDNCKNLLRTLPMLPLDEDNMEDVNTKTEDHAYDALRYAVMSRPMTSTGGFEWKMPARQRQFIDPTFGY